MLRLYDVLRASIPISPNLDMKTIKGVLARSFPGGTPITCWPCHKTFEACAFIPLKKTVLIWMGLFAANVFCGTQSAFDQSKWTDRTHSVENPRDWSALTDDNSLIVVVTVQHKVC